MLAWEAAQPADEARSPLEQTRRQTTLQVDRLLAYPFDKYSLTVLRNCTPEVYRHSIGAILNPKYVTMKFVDSEARY
jgi:hypothetical protein